MPAFELKSTEFRRERESAWRELEALIGRAEARGLGDLSADELHRLPSLYRGALSSLSVARSISLDRNLVDYLENLSARAYVYVYGVHRSYLSTLGDFFSRRFPALVWSLRRYLAAAVVTLLVGFLAGFVLTLADLDLFYSFVPDAMAQGRTPLTSSDELLRGLRGGDPEGRAPLTVFASFLFTHNAQIGLLCFTLGVAAGVPVAILLFYNGVLLGAFTALYHHKGLAVEIWGWLLPHGVTELLAVCLCGAAGYLLGTSWIFPGRLRRLDALARAGKRAAAVVVGSVALFFLAGLIEGYFRQLVTADLPRYLLIGLSTVAWIGYFGVWGRRLTKGSP